jgi:membrane fusion protein (multidrug efflux system)
MKLSPKKYIMRKYLVTLIAAGMLASCGSTDAYENNELSALNKEKDSLKAVKDVVSNRLNELEQMIAALDTTKKLTLVTQYKAGVDSFQHFFEVYGSVETDKNATLYPELNGKIVSINVKEGQKVSKGTAIMKMDTQILEEQIEELKTRLELAETTYKKQKKLWDQNIGSEMQYLQAKNQRDALRNQLSAMEAQMDKAIVRAPFAGIVDEIFPKIGEVAMPGMPAARLVNLDDMYIKADISENYMNRVKAGDRVSIKIESIGYETEAEIERTGSYVNPNNRTFQIKVKLNNQDGVLKPNMVALVKVRDFARKGAVTIPDRLVMDGANASKYVFVLKDKNGIMIAEKQKVKLGMTYKGEALIDSGLTGGEWLVDKGARSIKNKEQVKVVKE